MSDAIDKAQEREALDRELALRAMSERIAASHTPRDVSVDGLCIDCQEPIEASRLRVLAGKTSRCASCAHDFEHRMRGVR